MRTVTKHNLKHLRGASVSPDTKTKDKPYKDPSWLRHQFVELHRTPEEISAMCNSTRAQILKELHKIGIRVTIQTVRVPGGEFLADDHDAALAFIEWFFNERWGTKYQMYSFYLENRKATLVIHYYTRYSNDSQIEHGPRTYIRDIYTDYLNSHTWQKLCKKIKSNTPYCTLCKSTRNLHVHHLTYDRLGHEKTEDLEVLCRSCHMKLHAEQRRKK